MNHPMDGSDSACEAATDRQQEAPKSKGGNIDLIANLLDAEDRQAAELRLWLIDGGGRQS